MSKKPREGWATAMRAMHAAGADAPFIPDDLDAGKWAGKSFWDMSKAEQEAFFAEATTAAIAKSHALGLRTFHSDIDGKLYWFYPDGRREYEDGSGPVPPDKI